MSKYTAQLDGFTLELKSDGVQDSWEKNVVEYDIPFSNGAILDTLGLKSHPIRFTAIFRNENYEMHEAFVAHVSQDIVNTLVHPKYGLVKGMVKTVSVTNRDLVNYAEVMVEFLEDANPDAQPLYRPDLKSVVESGFIDTQALQLEKFADDVHAILGPAASAVLAVSLDPEAGILAQFSGLSMAARSYISKIESAVNAIDTAIENVTNPAESLISTIEYGTTLPGRVMGSIAHSVERYSVAAVLTTKSPLSFVNSFKTGIQNLTAISGPLRTYVRSTAAQVEAVVLSELYLLDDENRSRLARIESTSVWSPDGKLLFKPDVPDVQTINELEKSLAMSRINVQETVDAIRAAKGTPEIIGGLQAISAALVDYVDSIKLEREKIIEIYIDTEIPVHLLCLQYGLPYMAAERICAINNFWNPNFCSGAAQVYVGQN